MLLKEYNLEEAFKVCKEEGKEEGIHKMMELALLHGNE